MRKLLARFLLFLSFAHALCTSAQLVWTNQTPDIFVALFGNGLFVTAGEVIKISQNGRDWTTLQEGPFAVMRTGAFGNNRFVLSTGTLLGWSTNGTDWDYSTDFQASTITFNRGAFWAVGKPSGDTDPPGIYSSTDGRSWTSAFRPAAPITSLTSANDTLLAASSTNETTQLFTSADGNSWNEIAAPAGHVASVGYVHGLYLVGIQNLATGPRQVESSTNLINWSVVNLPTTNAFTFLTYSGGQFRATFSGGEIFASPDTITWTAEARFDVESLGRGVTRPEGFYLFGTRGWILFSPRVGQWEKISPIGFYHPETLNLVAYEAGKFHAAGSTGIVSSVDGVAWTPSLSNAGPISALASIDTNLFAFGPGTAFKLNGDAWSGLGMNPKFVPFEVATGSNKFVAATRHAMFTSADGANWSMTFTNANVNVTYAAFGNGRFVALGTNPQNPSGVISTNGVDWKLINVGVPNVAFTGLAFGNGIFLAAQDVEDTNSTPPFTADLYSSTDGENWTRITGASPQPAGRLRFANGLFFLLTADSVAFSADGVNWDLYQGNFEDRSTKVLSSIAYGGFRYVAVGGMVVTSTRPLSIDFLSALDLDLSLAPGATNGVVIEESTDLVNWGPLHPSGGDISTGYDIRTGRSIQRFFRAKADR